MVKLSNEIKNEVLEKLKKNGSKTIDIMKGVKYYNRLNKNIPINLLM